MHIFIGFALLAIAVIFTVLVLNGTVEQTGANLWESVMPLYGKLLH